MNLRKHEDERTSFSDRLKGALRAAGRSISPTRFAAEFNLRADGAAVSVHGARKWLVGDAIPTQARIQILAEWLGVSAAWLRFGDADNSEYPKTASTGTSLTTEELAYIHDMRLVSTPHRSLLRDILDSLLRSEKTSARSAFSERMKTS